MRKMGKILCIIVILLAAPIALSKDANEPGLRELKAMVKLQAAHIQSLKAKIADLKVQLAAAKGPATKNPTTRPAASGVKPISKSPARAAAKPRRKSVNLAIALKRKIKKVDFDNTPIEKAFQWLRDETGINLHVKW